MTTARGWQLSFADDANHAGRASWSIMDGDRLVGSMVFHPNAHGVGVDDWRVEIMWSGPTGDIEFAAPNKEIAIGFIKGVELAWYAVRYPYSAGE